MKAHENPLSGSTYYQTEVDFVGGGCSLARINGFYTDGRYNNVSESENFSMYDIEFYSGVLDTLRYQPLSYDRYAYSGGIDQAKKSVSTSFYGRHTLEWSLACESEENFSRAAVIKVL